MTDAARLFLGTAAIFAVLDWVAVAQRRKALEYVCKPAVMIALIAAAVSFDLADEPRRWAFVIALALSMLGDIFLMLPNDRFVLGVASFFFAHVGYVVGLRMEATSNVALVIGVALVAGFALVVGRRIVIAVRERAPELATPVSAYVAVISVMVASAIATGNALAAAGAIVFMASDTLIAWNRFVQPLVWAPVTIMATYHLGQAGLVLSLVWR